MKGFWNRLKTPATPPGPSATQAEHPIIPTAEAPPPEPKEQGSLASVVFQHNVAFTRMKHAVSDLQGAVRQIELGIREIQEGQTQHETGLEKTLQAVETLSAATEQVAASAQESAGVAAQADTLAAEGRKAATEAHTQMNLIAETVQKTGNTVIQLGQRTSAINRIVEVIQDIASQTNLLSLNAAIEAARAGDAGRGFAVVADEVRKLSVESASQARQIAGVVNEISQEIVTVTQHMDESLAAVKAGSIVVTQAGNSLEEIAEAAAQVSEMVLQISKATTEQAEGSQQIVVVSNALSELAAKVSYAIDKVLMDASQQQAALEQLTELSDHLGAICVNLPGQKAEERPPLKLSWSLNSDPVTLDPQMSNDMSTTHVLWEVFTGLTRFGPGTGVIPGLAQAWDLSPDGRTWTFQLRRGAKFHNGREVKAQDVKYSLERILQPELGSPSVWLVDIIEGAKDVLAGRSRQVSGIKVKNDYEVEITLEKPYHPFLANLAYTGTSIIARESVESGRHLTHPVGTGPFMFDSYEPGKQLVLKANPDFFGGRPFLDEVEHVIKLPEGKSELQALEDGTLDILQLNIRTLPGAQDHPVFSRYLKQGPAMRTAHIGLNCGKGGPLSNKEVRQAINLAINKQAIIDEFFAGTAQIASGPLPPDCLGHDHNWAPYPYDPGLAREKLRKAGYPNGLPDPLVLHVRQGNINQENMGLRYKTWLEEVGIRVDVRPIPWNELRTTEAMRRCDMYLMTWIGDTGDPDNFLQPLFNSANHGDLGNRTFFSNDEVDARLEAGMAIRDQRTREEHYKGLHRLIAEEAPWVFLFHDDQLFATGARVRGFGLHPLSLMRMENIWLDVTD